MTITRKLVLEIIPFLKYEDQLLALAKKTDYACRVRKVVIQLLELEKQDTSQLLKILGITSYNRYFIKACIPFLKMKMEKKSKDQILYIMEKSDWHPRICKIGLKILKTI